MKRIITFLACIVMLCMLMVSVNAETFNGTMVRSNNADPNLFFHDGKYYLTQTGTSQIAVFESSTLSGLGSANINSNIEYVAGKIVSKDSKNFITSFTLYDPTVEELFGEGAIINGTWSPEIHYISADMFGEEYEGWYMFVGLRQQLGTSGNVSSANVRLVVLKSLSGTPKGPYGHPTKGIENYSQPLLEADGSIHEEWACGQTLLTIPEGPYKGTYTMWVSEEGRGQSGATGKFYQKIMIAKMKSPWQLSSEIGIVTTPTQSWEYAGASSTHPRVVEGATPVYGKNGEIFITYSGSGYWSDYGLGQLTWNGGDPLETTSWVKLSVANGNPIFTATTAENLRGAGHASFLTDTSGNGFFCYHAYEYTNGTKASGRDAYIEPYSIDYTKWNGVSYGVIQLGLNGDGVAADTASRITFNSAGEYLTAPDVYAKGGKTITLTMSESGATGYLIYRSTDGATFNYLTTVDATTYTDSNVTAGNTYYYRAYAYREEEISDASATVSATAQIVLGVPQITVQTSEGLAMFGITAASDYDGYEIYFSEDGDGFFFLYDSETPVSAGETVAYADGDSFVEDTTYYVKARGYKDGTYSKFSDVIEFTMPAIVKIEPPTLTSVYQRSSLGVILFIDINDDCDGVNIYSSTDGVDFTLQSTKTRDYSAGSMFTSTFNVETAGEYYYYVTCTRNGKESEPSRVKSIDVIAVESPVISNVEATCKAVTLTFTENDEYDSYDVMLGELKTDEFGDYYSFSKFDSVTEPKYVFDKFIIGQEYCFAVIGVINNVKSPLSEHIFTTPAHNIKTAEALAPTCTDDGYTEYTYCEYCGGELGKEVVPATGHAYEETEAEVPATTESVGKTAVYTCANCGDSYGGEGIPKLEVEVPALAGDATGDGTVDVLDVLRTLKAVVGMNVEISNANADIDSNGKVDILDVLAIIKVILNK